MAIKYEQARNLKFNIWFFVATVLVASTVAIFAAYSHVTAKMPPFLHETFNSWLIALAQEYARPGAGFFGFGGREIIAQVASALSIHAEFVSSAKLIFVWAPAGALISVLVLWILGHTIGGWYKQTKGEK